MEEDHELPNAMIVCRPLALALLTLPVPALAQWTSGVHDTGAVRFEVFDNGKLGAFYEGPGGTNFGEGFVFEGEKGLFEGAFLVGQDFDQVSGDIYDFPDVEWATVSPVEPLLEPGGGVEAYQTIYDDSTSPNPIGLRVRMNSISFEGDPFVFVQFTLTNTSGGTLTGLHPGVFADLDVGTFDMNLSGLDEDTQLLYVLDVSGVSDTYFGVAAIDYPTDVDISGYSCDALPGDAILYGSLTIIQLPCLAREAPRDVRAVLGVGPYDLAAGETLRVTFAFVAGSSEAEIISNAEWAQQGFGCLPPCPATEPSAEHLGVALHAASPNPARGATTLSFTLDRPQPVRLAVLDALGREVAVLAEGERAPGEHQVRWETAPLPAGVYLVRLTAGGVAASRTVTLLR